MFDILDRDRRPNTSLTEAYMRKHAEHAAYFNSENGKARDNEAGQPGLNAEFLGDFDSASGPVDAGVLQYLTSEVGVSEEEVRRAGWVSDGGDLLVPARGPDGSLLAVRSLTVEGPSFATLEKKDITSRVSVDGRIELASSPDRSVVDMPIPFYHGLFNAALTWVTDDPVAALLLRSRGVNATSLTFPFQTLRSTEGLRQLESLGAITLRKSHRGALVVVDPDGSSTDERVDFLRGQFSEVWVLGEQYTGANFYRWVRGAIEADLPIAGGRSATSLEAFMHNWVRETEHGRLSTAPRRPLPPPSVGKPGDHAQGAIVTRPLASLGERSAGPDWLVEDFIAPKSLTLYHGVPKEGKSTFLVALLAQLSLSPGGEFLGRPSRSDGPVPVIYVTEESDEVFRSTVSRSLPLGMDLSDLPHFHVVTSDQYFGRTWEDVVANVRAEGVRLKARVIVFDTIANVSGIGAAGLYAPEKIQPLFAPAKGLALDGFAVVAVLHSIKGKGSITATIAGASTIAGWADQIVRIQSPNATSRVRLIDMRGRFSNVDVMPLRLSPEQVWSRASGPPPASEEPGGKPSQVGQTEANPDSLTGRILKVLPDSEEAAMLPTEVLVELGKDSGSDVTLRSVQNLLRTLVKAGTVAQRPRPVPGSLGRPHGAFYLLSSPSPSL